MGPSVKFHSYGRHGSSSKLGGSGRAPRVAQTALVAAFMRSQVTGRGVKSIRQLPEAVYSRFDSTPGGSTVFTSLAGACLDLEAGLVSNHVEACQRALCSVQQHLLCESSWEGNGVVATSSREAFVLLGGDILLLRALLYPFSGEDGVAKSASAKVLSVRKECLSLMHKLCVTVPFFAHGLAANADFLVHLFGFMYYTVTFDPAVGLAEDVLAAREDTLRVRDIPDFANLVRSFSSGQLASFCRVLAMVTFKPEAGNPWMEQDWSAENASSAMQRAMPEEPEWTVADQNHDAILQIPDILARLVQLLSSDKASFPREEIFVGEMSEWTTTMYLEGMLENCLEGAHEREDLLDWNIFLDHTSPTTTLLLSHHVEVLFVLCALCGGKRREQVQNCLAELGLVGVLNDMFDKLDWMAVQPHVKTHGIHGHGCACNPKSALKIQYLRLIHNFCDRDSCNHANKQLLLRPSSSKEGSFVWDKKVGHPKAEGLIVKILRVLMNEPADSLYRFWLASCAEAFLRGANNKDQEFVASTGLMQHLVDEILKGGFQCAPLLQINFDLLGELIKCNKTLFGELNRLLGGAKFNQFVEVMVANLVDSNVFVRSVVLSLDYFKRTQPMGATISPATFVCSSEQHVPKSNGNYKLGSMPSFGVKGEDQMCMISAFVSQNMHRLLSDLMCAVPLSDITQDNICVLNTALVFFLLAEKNGELRRCLQTLRAGDRRVPRMFRALLEFWRSYYLWKRGRERESLHYSTQLPFSDWLRIVDCLCAHSDSPYSLLHSGAPVAAVQCVALAATSEPPPRRR